MDRHFAPLLVQHRIATLALIGLFAVLASVLVMFKGNFIVYFNAWQEVRQSMPAVTCQGITCMRVGGDALGYGVRAIYDGFAGFMFMDPETSFMANKSPWDYALPDEAEHAFIGYVIVFVVVRMICLLPLLWLTIRSFQGFFGRSVFLLLAFLTLSGWPPPVIDLFFAVSSSLLDWPLSYYLFSQRYSVYDFATVGFICLLAIYLSRGRVIRWWEIVGLALFGQLIFENNGIVTGVSLFIFTIIESSYMPRKERVLKAFQRISIAAAASFTLALFFLWNYPLVDKSFSEDLASLTPLSNSIEYFKLYWTNYGSNNFAWINVIIANFITIVTIPAILGALTGLLYIWERRISKTPLTTNSRTEFKVAFSTACGFFSTLLIGFFVSGLSSDMGRQAVPLALMVLLAATKLSESFVRRGQ